MKRYPLVETVKEWQVCDTVSKDDIKICFDDDLNWQIVTKEELERLYSEITRYYLSKKPGLQVGGVWLTKINDNDS